MLLKDLERQVMAFAASLGLYDFEPRVNPAQLYGSEKDHCAHQLASIVVWIGYLQWKLKNGYENLQSLNPLGPPSAGANLNEGAHFVGVESRDWLASKAASKPPRKVRDRCGKSGS